MSRVTKFSSQDRGPADRVIGFIGHLRRNGLHLGIADGHLMLDALNITPTFHIEDVRKALKTICTGCQDDVERFDQLFDSFWISEGRVKSRFSPSSDPQKNTKYIHSSLDAKGRAENNSGIATSPENGNHLSECDGMGKLLATEVQNLKRKDLRDFVTRAEIADAENVAYKLGTALRDRRSRRQIADHKGRKLDLRRTIRKSISTGGEALTLVRKKRPDRNCNIAVLCDVSGSMIVYSRVFLAFIAGLMRFDGRSDAYLFHTRLVRVTEALRDKDVTRAIGRLSLLATGFGGGSKIGESLATFTKTYARQFVNSRSVVLVFSDGYDTGQPAQIGWSLANLKKRGCRIIWLNPLKAWKNYEPVTAGVIAARPHLDLFSAANTLSDLEKLEQEFFKL